MSLKKEITDKLDTIIDKIKDAIPTKVSELENDRGFITSSNINDNLTDYVKYNDIVDNLTSTDTNKPLSANQGRLLRLAQESAEPQQVDLTDIENRVGNLENELQGLEEDLVS